MAFCPNCGSQVEGKFCARCGTPMAAEVPPSPGPVPAGGYSVPPPAAPVQAAGLTENVACALCYLLGLFTGILFLVLDPYNKNKLIRFHAFQSIFAHLAMFAAGIVFSIFFAVFVRLPILGALVGLVLWPLFGLACLALWLMLMYRAYQGQKWVLPIIGPLAEKQA
jgi:uncharacterized membrane protein